ncbi:unnamed protein product [Ciceribacter selenitireducens ATCC BAA-1503]|uniref:Uncharacterized protein n=1 Tax=Ciceribacter selenitireducens ATCC BAA-1503 TaxID=1336235 RepID=A0A376AKV3_9HYPH|nr:unnamed protein product [Ciceribacter selenitireducens ATCC BAA-1503]
MSRNSGSVGRKQVPPYWPDRLLVKGRKLRNCTLHRNVSSGAGHACR